MHLRKVIQGSTMCELSFCKDENKATNEKTTEKQNRVYSIHRCERSTLGGTAYLEKKGLYLHMICKLFEFDHSLRAIFSVFNFCT